MEEKLERNLGKNLKNGGKIWRKPSGKFKKKNGRRISKK